MKLYSAIYPGFHPLDVFFPDAQQKTITSPDEMDEPGILIIHGGADISPSLYRRKTSERTYASDVPSRRDTIEWELINAAKEKNVFVFGICRGAQLLCAAAGGYLIQDVTNHAGEDHTVIDQDGKEFYVNSIHHQMCVPFEVDHQLLAWTARKRSRHYYDEDNKVDLDVEPEAVFYPGLGLGVQWHPEMLSEYDESNQWVKQQLSKVFHGKIG